MSARHEIHVALAKQTNEGYLFDALRTDGRVLEEHLRYVLGKRVNGEAMDEQDVCAMGRSGIARPPPTDVLAVAPQVRPPPSLHGMWRACQRLVRVVHAVRSAANGRHRRPRYCNPSYWCGCRIVHLRNVVNGDTIVFGSTIAYQVWHPAYPCSIFFSQANSFFSLSPPAMERCEAMLRVLHIM